MMKLSTLSCLLFLLLETMAWSASFRRVGVLEFKNLTGHDDHAWIAEAFTQSTVNKLYQVVDLQIKSRDVPWRLQGEGSIDLEKVRSLDPAELKRLSHMDYLIIGSIQAAGSLKKKNSPLRVHARFVDLTRGIIHDSVLLDGTMDKLYDLQYELATTFLDQLEIVVSKAEMESMKSVDTLSLEAYKLFNEGMIAFRQKEFTLAIQLFEEAMKKHPGILYGEAHHQLGRCYLEMGRGAELVERFEGDVAHLSSVYYDLGLAYEKAGYHKKASEAFRTFLDHTRSKAVIWEHLIHAEHLQVEPSNDSLSLLKDANGTLGTLNLSTGTLTHNSSKNNLVQRETVYVTPKGSSALDQPALSGLDKEQREALSNMDLVIVATEKNLEVKHNGKTLWAYQAHGSSKILAHTDDVLVVSDGKKAIRGLKIRKGQVPTDADGLLALARNLEAQGEHDEAGKLYKHLSQHMGEEWQQGNSIK
jgi:tetratricopeptide (TPR) repeat protein